MQIDHLLRTTLSQLQNALSGISPDEYAQPLSVLSDSSIGQHTRHIIEFFQVLIDHYESGVINYDQRKRNQLLESNPDVAQYELSAILDNASLADKELWLAGTYSTEVSQEFLVKSTYHREIVYNIEHAVHHMAMIKIGIRQSSHCIIPDDFGVAPATIQYRKSIQ